MTDHAPLPLRGAAALVTGASRGLGAALAEDLAARGAKVALVARGDAVHAVAERIVARGGEAHAIVDDVADKGAPHRVAAIAAGAVGPVDLLFHNASTLGPVPLRELLDTDCEELARVLETNVVGPFRLTKVVAGSMALRGRGLVVSISSDAAIEAYPRWGAYSLSKAALESMSRVFAAELEPRGVRFVAVDPGEMNTAMHADAVPDADPSALADPRDVARRLLDAIERGAPLGVRFVVGRAA
ncbi:MAG: SDR family oxidoreductase [Myxococcales bacterium]|jgi:NAD(P)-dependent dehydrogenase (short-subunit alcohol dehydrogenase family)|nr:SDR family oxidoreductase [Myxococcales bacterium]